MAVKYIAFDGKEFDNEQKCKDYEKENSKEIRAEIGNARHALKKLDDFCEFWLFHLHYGCAECPLSNLCDGELNFSFESSFYKGNPFGNIDVDGSLIEED